MSARQILKVPMEVQMSVSNSVEELRRVAQEMQKQFRGVDLSTPFGKEFTKIVNQINKGFSNIDASSLGTELFDEKDFKKVAGYIEKINNTIQSLKVHGLGGTARQMGVDITALEDAEEAYNKLKKAKEEYAKTSVGELAPDKLAEFEKEKHRTGFNANKTYKQNLAKLGTNYGVAKKQLEQLNSDASKQEREEAEKRVDAAKQTTQAAEEYYNRVVQSYDRLEEDLKKTEAAQQTASIEFAHQRKLKSEADIGKIFTGIALTKKGRHKSDVAQDYGEIFEKEATARLTSEGKFTDDGKAFVQMIAKWLDYTDDDIAKLMRRKATNIVGQLKDSLQASVNNNLFSVYRKAEAATKAYNADEYHNAEIKLFQANDAHEINQTSLLIREAEKTQGEADLAEARAAQAAAEQQLNELTTIYNNVQNLVNTLEAHIAELRQLSNAFNSDVDAQFNDKLKQAEQNIREASDSALREVRDALTQSGQKATPVTKLVGEQQRDFTAQNDEAHASREAADKAREAAEKEAADFKKELSASIKHWMSAQQIINIVKDGIRQAYQDIKALDSAMTNIAVVTDMSIGDLWGKINEYMSIAKQYGVTTQGVYEVSQLYYQQGLSTNEVMAATTETLKMARIAGMDYAEAADAMTVAIRAFKMEMTDAEHVTDVYSKVAAVTASDSEELAIAMSKTASSAESVGSSFENTTAMLAVMIETTRESAQNLGSALKSIISRYGEMKVGLTVDSEGEEIDYNKVDTALKSVGISIKDAQGQFRDFDDVIFELSEKWDGLDKNTQRYIATIMAGNRQQSRFIALVDNWERLEEVSAAAADSADAGLLQYAKTLDSLDTKLNNMKTSFQNFYMSIINGPIVAQFMGFIQNILDGFNKLGQWQSLLNVAGLINSVKLIGTLLVSAISGPLAQMRAKWKEHFEEITRMAAASGKKAGVEHVKGVQSTNSPDNWAADSKWGKRISIGGALVGSALTAAGTAVAANNAQAGSIMSGLGNVANFASMGAAFGPWGAAIGAIVGGLASLPAVFDAFNPAKILEEKIQKAEEALQEAEIERAQKKEDARNLEATLENLRKLQEARYDSEEAERAYIEASQTAIEKWPELANSMTVNGDQIVDVIGQTEDAELLLLEARRQAAQAALDAAAAENRLNTEKLNQATYTQSQIKTAYSYIDDNVDKFQDGTWAWDFLREQAGVTKYTEAMPLLTQLNDPNSALSQSLLEKYISDYGEEYLRERTDNGTNEEIWDWVKNDFIFDLNRVNESALIDGESVDVLTLSQQQQQNDAEIRQRERALSASQKAVSDQYIQTLTLNDNKAWATDAVMSEMAATYIRDKAGVLKFNDDGTLSDISKSKITQATSDAGRYIDEFYNRHLNDLEEMNALTEKAIKGSISRTDYIAEMERYFGKSYEAWDDIEKAYVDQYIQRDNQIRANYAKAIGVTGVNYATGENDKIDLSSYDAYLLTSKSQDTAKARYEYNELLHKELENATDAQGNNIGKFLINASEQQLQEYLALTKEAEKAVDIVGPAGRVAQDRIAHMQSLYTADPESETGKELAKLSPEAEAEFFRLLNTDAGTHKWAEDLNAFEKQYGVELGNWDAYAFENFSVRTQNIIDNAVSVTDTIKEIGEKHNKGFSWEESQKLLKQIQAIDPSATWTSLFDVTEDGLVVLADVNATMRQLYKKQSQDLDNQQATIDAALGNAKSSTIEYEGFTVKEWFDEAKFGGALIDQSEQVQAEFAKSIAESLGITDKELEGQILAGIQSGAITSYETLIAFLEKEGELLNASEEYINAQWEQFQGVDAFRTWSSGKVVDTSQFKKEGTLADYGDIWNKQINQKFDTTNWDQRDWDWWYGYYQKELIAAGASVDELGNVIWETETQMVDYYVNHLGYTREVAEELAKDAEYADWLSEETNADKLQNAAESFTKELIETGKVAAETVDAFVQAIAPNANAETQLAIRDMLLSGTDPEKIIKEINQTYDVQIDTNMITAVATDSANERTKLFFELYGKWLDGTITETELLDLQKMDVPNGFAVNFSEKAAGTIEQYYEYLGAAIEEGNEEIIKSARDAAKEATIKELNQIAAKGSDIETFQLAGQIDSANGRYSTDMLATLGAETVEFNKEAFWEYFHWDKESQSWLLDAGENMQDALVAIYGEEVPTYIVDAFEASELEERIAKEIEYDNNLTSIPEKFASLISDPLNATLEELIEFWESLLGRDLTTDEYQQVYDARQAAINGNAEMLNNMFDGWSSLAINQGYDVRWETIKQATFGEQAKNQANVEKWLNGEGTVDDLGQLWIDQYDAAVTDDTLEQFINKKIGSMRGAFIDTAGNLIVTDYEEFMGYLAQEGLIDQATLTQYAAEIQDTTLETIKSIFDYINKAIEGTLTATELRDMGKAVVNSGVMSADEWHTFASQNVSRVGTGYKMNEAAAFALQVNTGNYDFEDLVDQFDSIEEVNEMLEELSKNSKQFGDEFVDAAERVLESIKMIKAQDPGDAMFNWMDQDMEGWAGTYESSMGSIEKANEAIAGAMETGTMGLNDFYNMSQLMTQHLMATGDTGAVKAWQDTAAAIYDTATATNGGMVNIAEAGVDMEKVLSGFSKATEEHYQNIARQQIDFIDKQIAALEAQKKVEEALTGKDINKDGTISAGLTRDELILNEDDYLDYGLATQRLKEDGIGLYNEADYLDAEKEWLSKRPQYVAGEDQSEYNTPEAFANTVSMYLEEATRDALKAGLDITNAQVQQQIKDSAMARAGVSGYVDTLTDENLKELTTIRESVANIEKAVVDTPANTADTNEILPPVNNPNPSTTEEDILNHFNEVVITSGNQYGWGFAESGQMDEQQSSFIIKEMTNAFGDTWREVVQNSTQTVGGSQYTGSYLYDMNLAPTPINIPDATEGAIQEAENIVTTIQTYFDENPVYLDVKSRTATAESEVEALRQKINKTRASVLVDLNIQPAVILVSTDGAIVTVEQKEGSTNATGNVNGLAFATGTEKLIAGANLANKSLVGELGPELAVYNGQYHLLGANGAEFANIPSNAIIFNHKQTEGILKGQANIRGRVKDGGEAFAEGNISGPAYYGPGKYDAAIKALQEARAMWQSLLDRDLSDLAGIASQGGGGNVAKAYSDELEEWYNLLRQIADIEAEINQLVAERTNLQNEYNGEASLRNLREQQTLLNRQLATQEQLLVYQRAQLDRQKEKIANDKILSQFIKVNEDGIIQYRNGNERGDGKGAIDVLQNLNTMSAKEQLAYVTSLGFQNTDAAKDQDGKLLEGEDLVQAFYDYIQGAIDEYDGLNDTINNSTTELENIKAKVAEINSEVHQNELDLEQNIYDTYVDAWEASIDALEEQKDLIEEANDAYTEGLREALDAERKVYEDEASVADREKLQRELSLLRRSGGSASEIADLEEQLDNALKDEYFKSQEDMISDIEEANANQIKLLEKQIQIEEDTLEYEKENGVIWQKVADIMSSSKEEILAFLSGTNPAFFSQSKLTQIDALNEWAYSVGMYKEDQLIKSQSADFSNGVVGESADGSGGTNIWESEQLKDYKDYYAGLDDSKKTAVNDAYGTAYAQAIAEGATQEDARTAGYTAAAKQLKTYKDTDDAKVTVEENNQEPPKGDDDDKDDDATVSKTVEVTITAPEGHGSPTIDGQTVLRIEPNKTYTITPNASAGYEFYERQVGGATRKPTKTFSVSGKYSSLTIKVWYKRINTGSGEETGMLPKFYGAKVYDANGKEYYSTGKSYSTQAAADANASEWIKSLGAAAGSTKWSIKPYKTGGLVDYTGLAMVHGSASKPEAFLNAEQTAQIKEALMLQTKEGLLSSLQESLLKFQSTIDGAVSGITSEANNSSINIQPGAVVIQVEELANSYDVEKLSNDVMNRMTAIAAKATNRGVNRR